MITCRVGLDDPVGRGVLVEALLEAERYSHGPEDMNVYWQARRDALLELFACNRQEHESEVPHLVLEGIVHALVRDSNPADGIYECPPEIANVFAPYLDTFSDLEAKRQVAGTPSSPICWRTSIQHSLRCR